MTLPPRNFTHEELGVTTQTIEFVEALCDQPRTFLDFPNLLLGQHPQSALSVTHGTFASPP